MIYENEIDTIELSNITNEFDNTCKLSRVTCFENMKRDNMHIVTCFMITQNNICDYCVTCDAMHDMLTS